MSNKLNERSMVWVKSSMAENWSGPRLCPGMFSRAHLGAMIFTDVGDYTFKIMFL